MSRKAGRSGAPSSVTCRRAILAADGGNLCDDASVVVGEAADEDEVEAIIDRASTDRHHALPVDGDGVVLDGASPASKKEEEEVSERRP